MPQARKLLEVLYKISYQTPPPNEKLVGDLAGACSRRINIQHRLVYQILDDIKTVKIIRMWTHYEQDRVTTSYIGLSSKGIPPNQVSVCDRFSVAGGSHIVSSCCISSFSPPIF
ncbi:Txe/YoeB family addiction module toxin [uncultured Nitrospira sp.]|uniref:Txe/YoeB family addiction module toxin n=1 Tax=uncultured Nitrospira sp. TaxID=157176 RepID=UPI003140C0E4